MMKRVFNGLATASAGGPLAFRGRRIAVCLSIAASAAGAGLLPASAQASLIAYEPFEYASGNIAGRNGGEGWTGPWVDTLQSVGRGQMITYAPGLTHTLRAGSGNAMGATYGQQAIAIARPFERILLSQQTVWMSMLYRGGGTTESVVMGLVFGTQNGFGVSPAIRASTHGQYQLYFEGSGTAINLSAPGPSASRTDLIVMKYQALGGNQLQFSAFINPSNPNNPGTAAITRTVTLSTMEIAAFRFIYAGPAPLAMGTAMFDELGIAETYPGLTIPAPGGVGMLALVGLASLRRRR